MIETYPREIIRDGRGVNWYWDAAELGIPVPVSLTPDTPRPAIIKEEPLHKYKMNIIGVGLWQRQRHSLPVMNNENGVSE